MVDVATLRYKLVAVINNKKYNQLHRKPVMGRKLQ